MKGLLPCATVAAMLAATGAHGQDAAAPAKPDLATVEVHGSNKRLGEEVRSFVGNLTRLDGDLVSSWVKPVCPLVVSEDPTHAAYIRQRLFEIASEVPFAADHDEQCRANLFVIITSDPEYFVAEWKKRDPGMFIWRPRRGTSRSPETLPVRTWHNMAVEPAGGGPGIVGPGVRLEDIPAVSGARPSRIVSSVSENLQSALVLVDTNKVAGVTLRQLADYIALVSFSKVDLDADFRQANSILRLFVVEEAARPAGLTRWDLAFLRGLYRQSYEAVRQRMAITSRMVRDLVESAPAGTTP